MFFIKIIIFTSKGFFFEEIWLLIKFTHINFYFNDKQNYLRILTSTKNKQINKQNCESFDLIHTFQVI